MDAKRKWRIRALLAAMLAAGAAQAAEMTIYKQPNFSGDALTIRGDATDLSGRNFQDQVSSIAIHSGRWQVCTQPNFQGDCTTLERGQYASLDSRLNHRIESIREISNVARNERDDRYADNRYGEPRYGDDRYGDNRYGAGPGASVELFDGPDFRGRRVPVNRDIDSLARRGFDQQASSMVINEGTWQVCTQPGFEGTCRVFREGQYADLRRFDNRIGSLRRVG